MVIEIRRAGFTNKGAELMLRAAVEQIRKRMPDADVVMIPDSADSYCRRGSLCIKQKVWLQKLGVRWGDLAAIVPDRTRRRYGLYLDSEVDVVLDAAGFAYGDQWPIRRLAEAAGSSARWKRNGTKLILLPQALGPFTDSIRQRHATELICNAALVFPRDVQSYQHVLGLVGEQPYVQVAPDFTNLLEGAIPASFESELNRFCVIPNYRMIDKTDDEVSARYVKLMASIVQELDSRGAKPFLLIHEGSNDLWLAMQISNRLARPVNVVVEEDALFIKGIIGQSDGVVSSRFHGLVSALSQGVPALGTSWSHKYNMLFADYGFPEGVIDSEMLMDQIGSKIDRITAPSAREKVRQTILHHAHEYKGKAQKMWDKVFAVISP